jgi:hypothetical protein
MREGGGVMKLKGDGDTTRTPAGAEADRLAAEYEASTLNREQFCKQKGIGIITLARYATPYRGQQKGGNQPQQFVAVEVASSQRGTDRASSQSAPLRITPRTDRISV